MSEYLYRYIGFETFVGMVQNQALTFVFPELWEDPKESNNFYELLASKSNELEKLFLIAIYYKTYGQCWTRLSESDAMWRIYSNGNRAVRVKVLSEKLKCLDDVSIVPVEYSDDHFVPSNDSSDFNKSLSRKRMAFEHEKEVRLLISYKFEDDDDVQKHIKGVLAITEHPQRVQILESLFPDLDMKAQVEKLFELTNMGKNAQKTKNISFAHITDFIAGVMVHPQAPDWYVEIVQEFCKRNNITFEGKSELYCE